MSETFRAGSYISQNAPRERQEEGFCDRVTSHEGSTPHSRSRASGGGSVHRQSWDEYVPHDLNHEPYESAKARRSPQASVPPKGGPIDLGKVTSNQLKQLSKRSRKGKNVAT